MNSLTHVQALELIDIAANEDRLFHHNGGQAYIRISNDSNVLIVIDHTMANRPQVTLHDGTNYFAECKDYNWAHSKRLRDHGSLAEWFKETYPERIAS
jgi:hypothetical protein